MLFFSVAFDGVLRGINMDIAEAVSLFPPVIH
jgi:hypothetical protein